MAGQDHQRRQRIVLFPLPFQGRISPMLQLAALLHARGLAVTVLHTGFNAPDPTRHPTEFTFVPIHESFPAEVTSPGADIATQLLALNAACEAPFREALASLLLRGQDQDVACAVSTGSATRRCARRTGWASPRSRCGRTAPPRSAACSRTHGCATPVSFTSKASKSKTKLALDRMDLGTHMSH